MPSASPPEVAQGKDLTAPARRALYPSTGGFGKGANYEADRSDIPLTLIDLDTLAQLVEEQDQSFDSDGRGLLPRTEIYWPSEKASFVLAE